MHFIAQVAQSVERILGKNEVSGSIRFGLTILLVIQTNATLPLTWLKGNREVIALVCSVCKSQNYITTRNKVNMEGNLPLKVLQQVQKVTEHKESSKLK